MTRINIYCTSHGYSGLSEQASFDASAAHRTSDGLGVALWLPPGVHGADRELEGVVAKSMADAKQAEVGNLFERVEHYRPAQPHWYLTLIGVEALHRNKGYGAILLQHGLRQCDLEHCPAYLWSSNLHNISLYQRHGFEIMDEIHVGSSPSIFPMLRQAS